MFLTFHCLSLLPCHRRHVHRLIVRRFRCRVGYFLFGAVWILSTRRLSAVRFFHDVVDSFRFRAVWILSTRRLSVVRFVLRCC